MIALAFRSERGLKPIPAETSAIHHLIALAFRSERGLKLHCTIRRRRRRIALAFRSERGLKPCRRHRYVYAA